MKIYKKTDIDLIVKDLNDDKIVAFPTETVFGLGVKASKLENYLKMVEVKHRPPEKPFTLMCSSIEMASKYAEFSEKSTIIAKALMPGKLTLILKKKEGLPSFIDLDSGFVGIRIPDNNAVLSIIQKVGCPLLVPSANISGQDPILNQEEIISTFEGKIEGVLEGKCGSQKPSTIIKIDNEEIILIREGEISFEEIMEKAK